VPPRVVTVNVRINESKKECVDRPKRGSTGSCFSGTFGILRIESSHCQVGASQPQPNTVPSPGPRSGIPCRDAHFVTNSVTLPYIFVWVKPYNVQHFECDTTICLILPLFLTKQRSLALGQTNLAQMTGIGRRRRSGARRHSGGLRSTVRRSPFGARSTGAPSLTWSSRATLCRRRA
jgi:hypothetical protein